MTGLDTKFIGTPTLQLIEKMREEEARKKESEGEEQVQSSLSAYIRRVWERNRNSKDNVSKRLLNCLRARKGEYSPEQLAMIRAQGGADPVYYKITGTKSRAAASWIRDMILPVKGQCFSIKSTTIPELPNDMKKAILENAAAKAQEMIRGGMDMSPEEAYAFAGKVRDKVVEELQTISEQAMARMEQKIIDTQEEGNWKKALEEFIEDFVTYPFAVLKGPYYQTKRVLKWDNGKPVPTDETVFCWRRVSPFDIYPSPYARNIQEGELIERIRFSYDTLYSLIGMDGYKELEIREALSDFSVGKLHNWIWEDFDRDYLETGSYFLSDKDTIDALHYWGNVKGEDLIAWGYTGKIDDPQKMYPVDAILIGNHVIRAVINDSPMKDRPYHSACWDAIPSSLVGVALPEQMEDLQKLVNALMRGMATNFSHAAGFQTVVLVDLLAPGEDFTSAYPGKVWQGQSSLTGNAGKPVDFFQPQIIAQELLPVFNAFEQKADDVTNVPRYSYGNEKIGGAGSTATGLSMLMNSAAKGIRRAIANIDLNVIQPSVYQTFTKIMLSEPDPYIKGDCKIVPSGSAAILIKEQMQANQKEFLQITANPIDQQIMGMKGRAALLNAIADGMELPKDIVPSVEELVAEEQRQKQMQEEAHAAELAAAQAKMAPAGEGQMGPEQQMLMEQQMAGIEEANSQVEQKAKMVEKQAKAIETETNRLKNLERQVEEGLAQIAAERIARDLEASKQLADIEKAKLDLKMEGERLKALENKLRLTAQSKEEIEEEIKNPEKRKKDAEKKKADQEAAEKKKAEKEEADKKEREKKDDEIRKSSDATNQSIQKALTEVAAALQSIGGPKKITVEKDKDGNVVGAVAKPIK